MPIDTYRSDKRRPSWGELLQPGLPAALHTHTGMLSLLSCLAGKSHLKWRGLLDWGFVLSGEIEDRDAAGSLFQIPGTLGVSV